MTHLDLGGVSRSLARSTSLPPPDGAPGPVQQVMAYYPYVFHPGVVVGGGLLLLIFLEWRRQGGRGVPWRRLGTVAGAGLLSLVPTAAYMLVTGQGPFETMQGNVWEVDALVGSGMLVVAAVVWTVWRRRSWGPLVPVAMEALALVTLPYVLLSPVWNVSGHVVFALMPTLYLTLLARRFAPLLAIPIVMVPNRLYLETHTVDQVVGAFLMTTVLVGWVYYRRWADRDTETAS